MWKVGELAEAAGLTVRALHHFDEIGLLRPAYRSAGGHRLYTADDVRRLYRIVALRQLGIPLSRIARSLDGEPEELAAAIERQLRHVEAELLDRQRILSALREASRHREPGVDQLLNTIEVIMRQGDFFSDEQLDRFRRRHGSLNSGWTDRVAGLAREADVLAERGIDPAADEAQELARRWAAELADISGGDRSIVSAVYAKLDAKGAPEASKGLVTQGAWEFVKRALAVLP